MCVCFVSDIYIGNKVSPNSIPLAIRNKHGYFCSNPALRYKHLSCHGFNTPKNVEPELLLTTGRGGALES